MAQQPKPKAPTAEQLRQQRVQIISQKREAFAQGILFNLTRALPSTVISDPKTLAQASVKLAEAFLEALYTLPEKKD